MSVVSKFCVRDVLTGPTASALTAGVRAYARMWCLMMKCYGVGFCAGFFGTIIAGFVNRYLQRYTMLRELVWTRIASYFRVRLNPGVRRRIQTHLNVLPQNVRVGHPHQTAAALRNTATTSMHACARALGLTPYVVSPSEREAGADGFRCFFQLNDFVQQVKSDALTPRHCIIMTDIDYYVDWSYWMSFGVPILIYTFVPQTLGGKVDDGVFWVKDDEFTTIISGGGQYKHQVWDYGRDSAWVPTCAGGIVRKVVEYVGSCLGFWRSLDAIMFHVDQFQISSDRRIIALTPYSRLPRLLWDDEESRLRRLKVSTEDGRFNIMRVLTGTGSNIVISAAGEAASVTMPEEAFVGTRNRYDGLATKVLSDVVRFAKDYVDANAASILSKYLAATREPLVKATITHPGTPAAHYMCAGPNKVEDGKTYARKYANQPMTEEAVYPIECENNERMCIEKRINLPQRTALELISANSGVRKNGTVPSRFLKYSKEFVDCLVPASEAARGVPLTTADVVEEQDRPMQRLRSSKRVMDVSERFVAQSFQKREAYNAANDPRNITTCPTMHTLVLSSYTLAFKQQVLKAVNWYTPGRTPVDIATSIAAYCQSNTSVVEGDYSRFDGTITRWLRTNVEHAAYLRWVKIEYLAELSDLLLSEFEPKAFTKGGLEYQPGCSRLSGSPLTTDGNTMINAFVAFATLREMGADASWAFNECGLFYGDDSIMHGRVVDPDKGLTVLTRVAGTLGLQLKAQIKPAHTPVNFLSRVFPDPWTTPDSFADPMRAMLKIHTTSNVTEEINRCGFNKATSYLTTDPQTPFVSDWCRTYLRALGKTYEEHTADDLPYWYVVKEYRDAPWPQTTVPNHVGLVAELLTITEAELRVHIDKLHKHRGGVESIPVLSIAPLDVKVPCTVNGVERVPGDTYCEENKRYTVLNNGDQKGDHGFHRPGVRADQRPDRRDEIIRGSRGTAGQVGPGSNSEIAQSKEQRGDSSSGDATAAGTSRVECVFTRELPASQLSNGRVFNRNTNNGQTRGARGGQQRDRGLDRRTESRQAQGQAVMLDGGDRHGGCGSQRRERGAKGGSHASSKQGETQTGNRGGQRRGGLGSSGRGATGLPARNILAAPTPDPTTSVLTASLGDTVVVVHPAPEQPGDSP